jgi:hypothetical protein
MAYKAWQTSSITCKWTPAQYTMVWFICGLRPEAAMHVIRVNGVDIKNCDVYVGYARLRGEGEK